jgi:dUTP pyrophosphatase
MRRFEYVKEEFRKNVELQPLPARATNGSAGYDFFSPVDVIILPSKVEIIWTDIKAIMKIDEFLQVVPRSGLAIKSDLVIKNTIGIIDSDYANNQTNDGNIGINILNIGDRPQYIKKGAKIAQGIFLKYLTIEDESISQVRSGGFGSTG